MNATLNSNSPSPGLPGQGEIPLGIIAQAVQTPPEDFVRSLPQRQPVSWRSLLLGLFGVCFICGLTAFNDYVVNNTYMVGNFLPVGLVMILLVVIFLLNGPLWKWAPHLALSRGELAVSLGMMLVSCALPSSGLMRYLPGHLVAYNQRAYEDPGVAQYFEALHLPDWMFPTFKNKEYTQRGGEHVVQDFIGRAAVDPADDNFWGHMKAVPWRLWRTPAITWGIFLIGFYGMLFCISVIVRRQWVENERLAFPLATVYLALIDEPEPGNALNPLFKSTGFWVAFAGVFCIHVINGLNKYYPNIWPAVPLGFAMNDVLTSPYWFAGDWFLRQGHIYFCIIGICFFLQTRIAFSLWFTFVAVNLVAVVLGSATVEYTDGMKQDELFGACIPFVLTILWIGRAQWALVLKQMFRAPREHEPRGRYMPYFLAGWGLVLCLAIVMGWLMAVGASFTGSLVLVLMLTMVLLIVTRIVAETGLVFVQLKVPINRPWTYLGQNLGSTTALRTTQQSYFMTAFFNILFAHDARECMPVFTTNALRVADTAAYEGERDWRKAAPFTIALILSLVVGYFVSGASMLYTEYTYGQTLDKSKTGPINKYGVSDSPSVALTMATQYTATSSGPKEVHNRLLHFTGGAAVCAVFSALRLRYMSWPMHPIGLLLCTSYPIETTWFSIFLGWIAKALVVKFGGMNGFRNAKNFFIGLIVGEAAAAAFWLIIGLVRLSLGMEYNAINLLPT